MPAIVNSFMTRSTYRRNAIFSVRQRGFTLIELIVATAILLILTGLAIPLVRVTIQREREHELRYDLWMIRDAIDRYKDAADRGEWLRRNPAGRHDSSRAATAVCRDHP